MNVSKARAGFAGRALLWFAAAAMALVSAGVSAQEISSSIRGTVLQPNGQPSSGNLVVLTDTRDGSRQTVSTDSRGSAIFRNLSPGGPYTVRIAGGNYEDVLINEFYANISGTTDFTVTLEEASDAIEEIVTTAKALAVVNVAPGPSATFSLEEITNMPSSQRQIRDVIRIDPRIQIQATGDESSGAGGGVSCLGGSNRTNSFTIDGIRATDGFGLNQSGNLARFTFPVPFDAVGAAAVEFAPVNVEYGQFNGCNINVITKSGENEFHGSAFYLYNDDGLTGKDIAGDVFDQGEFDRTNWGVEVSGPILRDKLFFYAAYEEVETAAINDFGTADSGKPQPNTIFTTAEVTRIKNILESQYGRNVGFDVSNLPVTSERLFARIDWNINEDHRVEATYLSLDEVSQNRDDIGSGRGQYTFSENFFNRGSEAETYGIRVFSNWTDRFSTEFRYSDQQVDDIQDPLGGGEAQIDNIPRIAIGPFGNEFFGQEFANGPGVFRSANQLNYTTEQFKIKADYVMGDHTLTAGYELDQSDVFNLFIINATGTVFFSDIDSLEAGMARQIRAGVSFTTNPNDAAAAYTRDINAIYLQDEWQATENLQVVFGVRYDWYESGNVPLENPNYVARYGFTNQVAYDDLDVVQPRLGLTYQMPDRFGDTTLFAGFGVFAGNDPTVWFSNAYQNFGGALGVGDSSVDCPASVLDVLAGGSFQGIPQCIIDGGQNQALNNAADTNATDPNFELPSVYRYSFGIEHNTPSGDGFFNDWNLRGDIIYSDFNDSIDFVDLALTQTGTAPDGRPTYTSIDPLNPGCNATFNGPRQGFSGYTPACDSGRQDIFFTNRVGDDGHTFTISLQGGKRFEWGDAWSLDMRGGYVYNESEVGHPGTAFTAAENFRTQVTSDLFSSPVGPSLRNSPHNFVLTSTLGNTFFGDYRTTMTAFFQWRAGQEISPVFNSSPYTGDIGDSSGRARNLLYIPTGISDPNVSFGPGFDTTAFFQFIAENALTKYAGSIVPKGGLEQEDWLDLDIRFSQELPVWGDVRADLFLDFENVLNLLNDSSGEKRYINTQDIPEAVGVVTAGIVGGVYDYQAFTPPTDFPDLFDTLWRIQLGIRIEF